MSVILAISFAFAVITLSVSGSMIKTNDVFRKTTYGEWQLILPGINSKLKGAAANSDWLDELGVMNVYGTIGEDGIGTVDETLKKLGHITVNEGRFPESDGEIAMEADLLSKLGIDYTLGQDVTLSVSIAARENSALGTSHPVNVVGTLSEHISLSALLKNTRMFGLGQRSPFANLTAQVHAPKAEFPQPFAAHS